MSLELAWYLVVILSLVSYAVLDGFDLGVGILHLFVKGDKNRRILINAIGPVWDGNEVWLVIIGGALFAGFPGVFASIFSAFYIPVMILLMGLIFRAVAIEMRSKHPSEKWRRSWDRIFFGGSFVIAIGVGVVLGNLISGIPLDSNHDFTGTIKDFIHPYSLLVGVMAVSLFAMHGAIFLVMKTQGKLQEQLRRLVLRTIILFCSLYLIVTITTIYYRPYMLDPMRNHPWLFLIPLVALVTVVLTPILSKKKRDGWAFVTSCSSITLLLSLASIGTFPYMVRSSVDEATNSLLISNSASSALTLKILLIIVAIGIPLVLAYGFYVYRVFRGKVELDSNSY